MPPTIQTNVNADRDKRPAKTAEKRSELVCRVKYCNTLPDIPFDPKFITYPFESRRFIEYNPTSLERNYKYEVLTEHDLGVTIDLINKDLYTPDFGQTLDPADEKLLEEDILAQTDSKRSRHHGMSVSWLRRTEYISTEQTRFQPQTMDKVEAKVGYSIKKNFKDETLYMDRESQIKAIEKTFVDSKQPIDKHYSKPNVTPVEVLPIFPDFKLWKYPCAQVIFDSDPAPVGRPVPAQIEEMSQAMIRGVMDESGEQFVAYFLPTELTLEKRRHDFTENMEYTEDEEYEYKMAREYNWNVKSKASKGYEENYFLVMRPEGVYYNELETRVRLSKRRQKAGQQVNNTRLVVTHRTLNAAEFKMQRYREKQLEPPNEEEEDEEEEEEEEDEATQEQANKSDDEEKAASERDDKGSGNEKEDSEREDEEGGKENKENDKEGDESDQEKDDGDKEKAESDKEKGGSDKEESENERGESDGERHGSDSERHESDGERHESDGERQESDGERHESDGERHESEGDRHESDQEEERSSKKRNDSEEARSNNSSSDSGSASEGEGEGGADKPERGDAASHSSGSRSSSRSRSPSHSPQRSKSGSPRKSQSRSRSPSPSGSGSASGSGSDSE